MPPGPLQDGGGGQDGFEQELEDLDPDEPYPDDPDSDEPFPDDPFFGDPFPDDPSFDDGFPDDPAFDDQFPDRPAFDEKFPDEPPGREGSGGPAGPRSASADASPTRVGPCALVAVEAAAPGIYSYRIPPGMEVRIGQAVLVPFAGRDLVGYVMGVEPEVGTGFKGNLKPLRAVIREEPLFGPELTGLARTVSEYYSYPVGLCVREILPGGLAPKIMKKAALTEKGERAASDPSLASDDPLLTLLKAGRDPVPLSAFRTKGAAARLGALAKKGLVKISYCLSGKGAGFTYETVLSPVPDPPDPLPRLGRVEKELWERLQGAPPTPMAHFRHYVKDPLRVAKSLNAKGLVRMDRMEIYRDDPTRVPDLPRSPVERLTGEQEVALGAILEALDEVLGPDSPEAEASGIEGPFLEGDKVQGQVGGTRASEASGTPGIGDVAGSSSLADAGASSGLAGAGVSPGLAGAGVSPGLAGTGGSPSHADARGKGPVTPETSADGSDPGAKPSDAGRFLLFGVTGSGKTEVYLRAAKRALARGGGVLWLTPEIALTMGLEARIKRSLPGTGLAVLHSLLSAGERHDHWMNLARGRLRLALGARSAVWAPVRNLKLVIVDEEHDWAYKQEEGLRYHGRDMASLRARESGAVLVLGSATPSLESYHAAEAGRLRLLTMRERPGDARLPEVRIHDRRSSAQRGRILSPELRNELTFAFRRKEQALLFVNRRGWASLPICLSCGEALRCPSCSLNLTLHGPQGPVLEDSEEGSIRGIPQGSVLVCHGCGWRARPPAACPSCGKGLVRYMGAGTERILESCEKEFGTRGLRLDADSTRRKGGLKAVLGGFERGEAAFLVGTQMAAKGHDFPNLTVVGVLDADIGLNLPDFRAAERTFQLLSQVSGRAGRADKPGKVIVQTLNPDHYSVAAAKAHDYRTFYENEIETRRDLGLPPFGRLALLRFSGPDEGRTEQAAERAGGMLRALIEKRPDEGLFLLGPAPSPVEKLKERYRFQMMLRAGRSAARNELLAVFAPQCRKALPKSVAFSIDVDPYHLM
ncbi:MAG: primosomal protein N' [Deltaproteobacteria bacterium]|jgi:primosomal protein N'|nr:primosomal protein N' [Deltaproteobacteria bacterium]